jgi:hypothetical protein
MKAGYRLRPGDQIPTRPVTLEEIMGRPQFALGVADARAARRYHRDYDLWSTNGQWSYERGRMWATLAPRNVPLKKVNGRINPDAVRYWRGEII